MPDTDQSSLYHPVYKKDIVLQMAPSCRIHVAWVVLPFVMLLALQIGFAAWIFATKENKPHFTAVIDIKGTQRCLKFDNSRFPCVTGQGDLYTSSGEPLSPLKCRDDAFEQKIKSGAGSSSLRNNCLDNPFRISTDGKGVVIPEDGLYRVYAGLTFHDSISHHNTVNLRIDSPRLTECHGNHECLEARNSRAHTWLTCHSHQPPSTANGVPDFATCSMDGIRHFFAGEIVGLQVSVGFRNISGHYKSTHMYIHRL